MREAFWSAMAGRRLPLLWAFAALCVSTLSTGCLPEGDQVVGYSCSHDEDCLFEQGFVCRPPRAQRLDDDYSCEGERCECVEFECNAPSDCEAMLDDGRVPRSGCTENCGCVNNLCEFSECDVTGASAKNCSRGDRDLVCHPLLLQCVECISDNDCGEGWRCDFEQGTCWERDLSQCGDDVAEAERSVDTDGDGIGDTRVRVGEDCDGTDLRQYDCLFFGAISGDLVCNNACEFDTTGCVFNICGNGVREGNEACDGDKFGGATCATLDTGYGAGFLTCTDTCRIDRSNCSEFDPAEFCGDGEVAPEEACDDNNTTHGDGCNGLCQVENGWTCMPGQGLLHSVCTRESGACPGPSVTFTPAPDGPSLPVEVPSGRVETVGQEEVVSGGVALDLIPGVMTEGLLTKRFIFELETDHPVPPDLGFAYTLGPRLWQVSPDEINWNEGRATVIVNHPGRDMTGVGVPPRTTVTLYDYREGDVGQLITIQLESCLTNSTTMAP